MQFCCALNGICDSSFFSPLILFPPSTPPSPSSPSPLSTPPQYAQGYLSVRMQQPNNAWVEAWQDAAPFPAYKQKRLFDDTKEAEKVLHSLAGLRVCDVALSVMPVVLHAALETLGTRQSECVCVCAHVSACQLDLCWILLSVRREPTASQCGQSPW